MFETTSPTAMCHDNFCRDDVLYEGDIKVNLVMSYPIITNGYHNIHSLLGRG